MLNSFDDMSSILKLFFPLHIRIKMQDWIVDTLAEAYPDERWRKLIRAYRSDAAFQEDLAIALERAIQRFAIDYEDKELVKAVTQSTRYWDIPSVRNALKEIIVRPFSYLKPERTMLKRSFTDVLPTAEPKKVDQAVGFFLRCLTEEVINIPQLAPIYQVQLQWMSLEQGHRMVGLQQVQKQLMATLIDIVTQNQLLLAPPADRSPSLALPKLPHNLPPQYGEFLGREKDIQDVLEGLSSRWPLISIEGLGGIGKTALARQIALYCLTGPKAVLAPLFEYVVWVSAKDQPEQKLWLNEVLDTTARVLGYPSISNLPPKQIEQKKVEVGQLLGTYRTLLIMDNFETIEDSALESWIQRVPEPSKVLITSRKNQLRRTWNIILEGLEEPIALELIRNHAQRLGLHTIKAASEDTLLPLVRVTGANPKAIELALGHVKRGLSLKDVIEHVYTASKTTNDVFDDLFVRAWRMVTKHAQHVLQVATFFVDFVSQEALAVASGLMDYELDTAMEELVDLMLLRSNGESTTSNLRYSIHPLTRAFVGAQLQHEQDFEEQARIRWGKYYLNFATRYLVREQPKERYWNSLPSYSFKPIDQDWSNFRQVLEWADQHEQGRLLIELMLLLVHYMDVRLLQSSRIYYAQRAAQAASNLGWKEVEAYFRIDALGWILIDEGKFIDAEQEITRGIYIVESLGDESPEGIDLFALGNIFLARMFVEQGEVKRASEFMNKIEPTRCHPVIRNRACIVAGDIAFRKKNSLEAIQLFEMAIRIGQEYGGEGDFESFFRLGLVYLANRDLEKAETHFNKARLSMEYYGITLELINSLYGLARVAKAKGERDKARQLALEGLDYLSRAAPSHWLLKQIRVFLQSLETK